MDHFYKKIKGFMLEKNRVMFDIIISKAPANCVWVELGSWTGKSAAYCVVELLKQNKFGKFYCVDTWEGSIEHVSNQHVVEKNLKDIFVENTKPISDKIVMKQKLSWESAKDFSDNSIDVCYVDAAHDYHSVKKDLEAWWPKVKIDGWFVGDDFTKSFPGCVKAVREFFSEKDIPVQRRNRCWIVKKTENGFWDKKELGKK